MLGKLLKYEIPAAGKRLVPVYIAIMVLGLLLGIAERTGGEGFFGRLTAILYIVCTIALIIWTIVVLWQRFHKNLLEDEGYFWFVLPVDTKTHILSKTISALLWTFASGLAAIVSALVMGLVVEKPANWSFHIGILGASNMQMALVIFEVVLLVMVFVVLIILQVYAAESIARLANRFRELISSALFVGFWVVINIISNLVGGLFPDTVEKLWEIEISQIHMSIWLCIAGVAVLAAIFFTITNYILDRHLNLE